MMGIQKTILLILPTVAILFISGCSNQAKPLYNYGDYSDSYYDYKKNANAESALAYQKSIESAIENAKDSRSGRVAPGMYANLGYIYLKSGKSKEAVEYFVKEKTLYPESAHFMDRMINKIEAQQGDKK